MKGFRAIALRATIEEALMASCGGLKSRERFAVYNFLSAHVFRICRCRVETCQEEPTRKMEIDVKLRLLKQKRLRPLMAKGCRVVQ